MSRIYLDKHQREMPMDKNRLPVAAVAFCKMQWYNDSKKILQRDKEGNAMELDEIYKRVQEIAQKKPLLFVGTGGSIPYGIPGMDKLCERLKEELSPIFAEQPRWNAFLQELDNGDGLESALLKVTLPDEIQTEILNVTWNLVTAADLKLFRDLVYGGKHIALGDLIQFFYRADPQCVSIITTNYDRMIEYACDFASLPMDVCLSGQYYRIQKQGPPQSRNIVNLLKVHGSLDLFQDTLQRTFALPLQEKIPDGLTPKIITPGVTKFQSVFHEPFNGILHSANNLIGSAQSYLCIGYGFNDEHIQAQMLSEASRGKPVLLITKDVSDHAAHLLAERAQHYVTISEGSDPGTSEVVIDKNIMMIEGDFWKVEGLLTMLQGG